MTNRDTLRQLIKDHNLTRREAGDLVHKSIYTIDGYLYRDKAIPLEVLELLELKLKQNIYLCSKWPEPK